MSVDLDCLACQDGSCTLHDGDHIAAVQAHHEKQDGAKLFADSETAASRRDRARRTVRHRHRARFDR